MSIGTQSYSSSLIGYGTTFQNSANRPYKILLNRTAMLKAEYDVLATTYTSAENQALLSELYNNTEVDFTFIRVALYHYSATELVGTLPYGIFPITDYDYEFYQREEDWYTHIAPTWYRSGNHLIYMQGPFMAPYVTLPSAEWAVLYCITITYDSDNDLYIPSINSTPVGEPIDRTFTGIVPYYSSQGEDAMAEYLKGAYDDMDTSDNINPEIGNKKGVISGPNGFVNIVQLNTNQIIDLKQIVGSGIFGGHLDRFLISLKRIYLPSNLLVGETSLVYSDSLTHTLYGQYVTYQYQTFSVGTFQFSEYYNSFLDYTPYTSIKIYLPFCGVQSIDPELVMGGSFILQVVVDMLSGNMVYYGTIIKDGVTRTIYSWNGNCCIEVPLNMEDYGGKVTRLITSGAQVASAMIAPSFSPIALSSAGRDILDKSFVNCGSLSANNGLGGVLYPYIIISRKRPKRPSNYNSTVGRPCMKVLSLGSCTGFTKVKEVHLVNMTGAFKEEIDEIETLLKEGVIF